MYVGKNNYQNEDLTFKLADGGDWWFHAKNIPGSHVIVKTGQDDLADKTFEEATRLAHYNKGKDADKLRLYQKRISKSEWSACNNTTPAIQQWRIQTYRYKGNYIS